MGSALVPPSGDSSTGHAMDADRAFPADRLLRTLFDSVPPAGWATAVVEPGDIAKRVPALEKHSGENIHGAFALGGSRELLRHLDSVEGELASELEGEFQGSSFKSQFSPIKVDIARFLSATGVLASYPAIISASSRHVHPQPSGRLAAAKRRLVLTPGWDDPEELGRRSLTFPRLGLRLPIHDYAKRFEKTADGGSDPPLVSVRRRLVSLDARGVERLELVTQAIGFAPDCDAKTLSAGGWHAAGRGRGWAVLGPGRKPLFTRNQEIDAWMFIDADDMRKHVFGQHLHLALTQEGRLLDVNATERYMADYLRIDPMLRCAIEKLAADGIAGATSE